MWSTNIMARGIMQFVSRNEIGSMFPSKTNTSKNDHDPWIMQELIELITVPNGLLKRHYKDP